ncbi:MAG: HlyD family efflux transporter periplasmic adaptor subunit [Reichenbachiella sp.]|uniref:HlyD family secretion protein n=1 Tax=Reichenbachiella sp. TaxID=2184521 RepID=UPI00329794AD
MKNTIPYLIACLVISTTSCTTSEKDFDASGAFEAVETILSSEASGVIQSFDIQEGQQLRAGQWIGYIDSTQTYLKKKQLEAQIQAMLSRKPNVSVQLATLQTQLKTAQNEQKRITNLVKEDAATTKQLDDINAQVETLKKQIAAQRSTLTINLNGLDQDANSLNYQLEQLDDMLQKYKIINPVDGTVLGKYAEAYEMTQPGKVLYKIADLSTLILRVYITGNQLATIKLNQEVTVKTDDGNGGMKTTQGQIIWISEKAEFTPKTIQTKDERANLVYAVKVSVVNDGSYKIGMYGEIQFL